jgi:putative membrane protein
MERKKYLDKNKEILFLYIIFSVGIIGHLYVPLRSLMLILTPLTLLLTGSVVLYSSYKSSDKSLLLWILITYILTFILEVAGVKTGMIFGDYIYGKTLGIKLFDVPLIIGFNWVFVILGSISTAIFFTKRIFLVSFISASICVIFDLVLEPVAIKLGYWNWIEETIPFQNYLAWFIIAFVSSLFFLTLKVKVKSRISIHYLFVQFVFFIILFLFYK